MKEIDARGLVCPEPVLQTKAVIEKKIDMFIYDAPMIIYLASENETKGLTVLSALLTEEYLAWGFRKDDKDLLKSANDFLRTINDEGKLNQIIQYWIPPAR